MATGRVLQSRYFALADTPRGHGSDAQIVAAYPLRVIWYRPKHPRPGKCCDAGIVITEDLPQHCLGMFAKQGRRYRVGGRREVETDRLFDVGDRARGRVRGLADA